MLGLPLDEAVRMASLYPARFLGIADRVGRIHAGMAADLVWLDDNMQVLATWIGGRKE
jgi:N-acetylglucosamine-6-phosphate deacetylase